MKICVDCDTIVEKPYETTYGAYYGAVDPTHIRLDVWECPKCGSNHLEEYYEHEQELFDEQVEMYERDNSILWSDLREYCPSDWTESEMLDEVKDMVSERLNIHGHVIYRGINL